MSTEVRRSAHLSAYWNDLGWLGCLLCRSLRTFRVMVFWSTIFSCWVAKVLKNHENLIKSGMVQRKKCAARKTLKNDALDAKIGVDTAVNEPLKV